MTNKNFTTSFMVDQSPQEVFDAANNVKGWWNASADGDFTKPGDEFSVRFADVHYSKQRIVTLTPGEKVIWLVTESHLNFLENKSEWTGTSIAFEIYVKENKTQLQFIHEGLSAKVECYDACSNAWSDYIKGSLFQLITTGAGKPFQQR